MYSSFLASLLKAGLLVFIVLVFSLTTACHGDPQLNNQATTADKTGTTSGGSNPTGSADTPPVGGITPIAGSITTDSSTITCNLDTNEAIVGCWKSICLLSPTKANIYVQLNSNYLANTSYEQYINEHLASDCTDVPTKTYTLPGIKTYLIGAEEISTSGLTAKNLANMTTITDTISTTTTTTVSTAYYINVSDNLCFAIGGFSWPVYDNNGGSTTGGTTGGTKDGDSDKTNNDSNIKISNTQNITLNPDIDFNPNACMIRIQ